MIRVSKLDHIKIRIDTLYGEISNITIDAKNKQFRGIQYDKDSNMMVRFIDFTSDLGKELMDIIRLKDNDVYEEIKRSELCN